MSDRLALANAIEDAGIERGKAAAIASVIFDVVHGSVATKADVQASEAALKAALKADIAAVHADFALVEHRLLTRLGGMMVVAVGVIIAVLHYWQPHG